MGERKGVGLIPQTLVTQNGKRLGRNRNSEFNCETLADIYISIYLFVRTI